MHWRVESQREMCGPFGRVLPLSLAVGYPKQVSHAWVANERNVKIVIASG